MSADALEQYATTLRIDPNVRVRGNQTMTGYEDLLTGDLPKVAQTVRLIEEESGLRGTGIVTAVDQDKRLIYVAVDWSMLRWPDEAPRDIADERDVDPPASETRVRVESPLGPPMTLAMALLSIEDDLRSTQPTYHSDTGTHTEAEWDGMGDDPPTVRVDLEAAWHLLDAAKGRPDRDCAVAGVEALLLRVIGLSVDDGDREACSFTLTEPNDLESDHTPAGFAALLVDTVLGAHTTQRDQGHG